MMAPLRRADNTNRTARAPLRGLARRRARWST